MLMDLMAQRGVTMGEGDDRYDEDSPEMEQLRGQLESQYDFHLEDAAMKGFGVSLASPAGKRYTLYKKRCKEEREAYEKADDAKKKAMIKKWIQGEYERYMDGRAERANLAVRHHPADKNILAPRCSLRVKFLDLSNICGLRGNA